MIAAAFFEEDGQVDPPALLRALVAAAARNARITIRSGATVQKLHIDRERCLGVTLDDGELLADATVLAAGSWSSLVQGVPSSLPAVKPVRGQIVLLDERPPRLRTIVFGASTYVVPRGDGRVVCGSTTENAGFRKEVTAAGLEAILLRRTRLRPVAREPRSSPVGVEQLPPARRGRRPARRRVAPPGPLPGDGSLPQRHPSLEGHRRRRRRRGARVESRSAALGRARPPARSRPAASDAASISLMA